MITPKTIEKMKAVFFVVGLVVFYLSTNETSLTVGNLGLLIAVLYLGIRGILYELPVMMAIILAASDKKEE